ncbi:MAG TPA: hypothetical protein VE754_05890 [Actinomycetota bacterium]|jgi:hypothetical protein|nr:hypothetical protein [Actinomycetota bacterium]
MTLAALAERIGARDMFVLRFVDEGRLVNVDGFGRGAGWAGNLTVRPDAESWPAEALQAGLLRARSGLPERIFGPYWSTEAVGVATEHGLVVFGGPGMAGKPDELLRQIADEAASRVEEVPVAKRLADELEVSQAALAIATLRPGDIEEIAVEIANRAAEALSCEFGALLLTGSPPRLFLASEGWRPPAGDEEIIAAILPLAQAVRDGLLVEQDVSCSSFPYHPLAFDDGLVARAVVPLGADGKRGVLVVAHAADAPRGFTSLCQRVLVAIARATDPVLDGALAAPNPARA